MENVISFSGGKDSLALLYLLEPIWHKSVVLWCNAGAPYDETLKQMEAIRAMVPHFLEVKSDVVGFIHENGFPADLTPQFSTKIAENGVAGSATKFCSTLECCANNLWLPTMKAIRDIGATVVYRGQKNSDEIKSSVVDGQVIEGIAYKFPLAEWSDQMVMDFLGDRLPPYYTDGEVSSRDCWCCTGYLQHNAARIKALPHHRRIVIEPVLRELRAEAANALKNINSCVE